MGALSEGVPLRDILMVMPFLFTKVWYALDVYTEPWSE